MKFKNKEDYLKQRKNMLDEAKGAIAEGKIEDGNQLMNEIQELDNEYEIYAQAQADITALAGGNNLLDNMMGAGQKEITGGVVDDIYNTLEYRKAFMNNVLKGAAIPAKLLNSDSVTVTTDVGSVIPTTILNKIVEKMENVGGVYAKLTKTFYRGGVSVPTSSAKPVATWTSERGTSDKQKKATGSITFSYHKLRCVVACSIMVDNVTLDIFETTLAKNIADAMIKAIEEAAFNGAGATSNQPEGILKATVPEGQTIEIAEGTAPKYADFCAAEGALPEEYESGTEWYMKKSTFFNQVQAMVDDNGQPIARTNYGLSGKPEYSILGRKVNFVSYVPAFAESVTADTIFAVMYNFSDYLLNTNLQVTIKEYEDHDTDDQVKKAIMLVDGKPTDLNSLVVMMVKNS